MVKFYPIGFKVIFILFVLSHTLYSQTFPAGFSQVKVGTVYYPTALAAAPDGRIFVCEKGGRVKVVKNGVILSTPFLQVSCEQTQERGLSGIAFDPDFATNKYVYIFYTTASSPIHNRLSRFTANGDVAVQGSETVLIEFEPVVNAIHNGGGMLFGNDGKLYIGMGDDHVSSNASSLTTHKGKILRLNKDGSGAAGNPYSGSVVASRIWDYGFRNPYSISINRSTGKIFTNEVGEGSWEEINDVTTSGKNYGWPGSEGYTSNPSFTGPVYAYAHGNTNLTGCAVSGGAFFSPSSTNYPSQYIGKYFFIDYCNKWMNYISSTGGPATTFATNLPGAGVGVITGTDGNIYYLSISSNGLYKIVYNGSSAPTIVQHPSNVTLSEGEQAVFSVAASGSAPLNYQWYKNNIAVSGANSSSYTISNAQSSNQGSYKCTVSNTYGSATSNSASLTVTAFNSAPVAQISAPPSGTYYRCGDTIGYSGSGTDPEDGTLPPGAFTWIIEFHHDRHVHPGPVAPDGVTGGSFYIPFTGESSANVFYRIKLIVTDSENRTDTATRDVYPMKSKLTLASNPAGLQVTLDGQPFTTTYTLNAVEKMKRMLGVVSPQSLSGTTYTFSHWLHGGAATQEISVPENDVTYTAVYNASGASTSVCGATGNILREYWANVTSTSLSEIPFNSAPTSTGLVTVFEGPQNAGSNYGSRIRGFICPPATGNYTFWIASDNASELWISTDATPNNKVKRASVTGWTRYREWNKYASQQSSALYLVQGQKYYIEAIHRESVESDHLSVGWQMPGNIMERPIPGSRLSPPGEGSQPFVVTITSPSNNSAFSAGSNITMAASVSGGGTISKVEFYSGAVKLGEDLGAPYNYIWNSVPAGTYTLTAKAFGSNNATVTSSPVKITVNSEVSCSAAGNISREVWFNVSGTAVSNIPVNTSPGSVQLINSFQAPSEAGDNYGQRVSGYICAPVSGNYIFWIASDDNSELWLSTNDQKLNRQKIASVTGWTYLLGWTKYPSQQSAPVSLVAGQKYYIEALHKEGGQGDHLAVGWQLPGGAYERPIPGSRLSPFITNAPPSSCEALIQPGGSTTFCQGGIVLLYANTGNGFTYQWKKNGVNISGATNATYLAASGGDYQVKIAYPGCTAWSAPTKVTVNSGLTAKITPGGPTTFCEGGSVTLYGNYCSGYVYQWKRNNVDIPGANSQNYIATVSGSYQLKIVQGSSVNWSALVNVTVNNCAGSRFASVDSVQTPAPSIYEGLNVKVFPNPTTGEFTFDFCMEEVSEEVLEIRILNASTGQVVYSQPPVKINGCLRENIQLPGNLATGIYVLQIQLGSKIENTKLILAR